MALREFLNTLKRNNELHVTEVEIDPVLELTEVSVRALREGKPALLVKKPNNSAFPLAVNFYASDRRIELALGRHPDRTGEELIGFLDRAFPPSLKTLFEEKATVRKFLNARPRQVRAGESQEIIGAPDLSKLPVQKCWEHDGGKFITYGQVFTYDPRTDSEDGAARGGKRNIGIYRMHVFDGATTGMHWQIQKGGGFHYFQAEKLGKNLELAVALGCDPALLLASVAALPEGIDEAMFAGFLQNKRVDFVKAKSLSISVPANAEFILEGVVPAKERRMEGPFGDHFGHYSNAAEFPVFHIKRITHRRDAIYPAIVVGKPPMEDKFLGDATQQILGPLAKLIHKEIASLWAYYEAGFHNLLVVAIEQRYQKEAIKAALGLMGTDQLSLTKCIVAVSAGVNVRDWFAVVREIKENFDPHFDFIMIPKVPLDTLDFTSYKMNLGSKMIVDATRKVEHAGGGAKGWWGDLNEAKKIVREDSRVVDCNLVDGALLIVKVKSEGRQVVEKLVRDPRLIGLSIIAAVSEDVEIMNKESYIWGIFTRFDCERDVVFTETGMLGVAPIYKGIMGIDATWKPGYPAALSTPDEIVKRVDEKWGRIWK